MALLWFYSTVNSDRYSRASKISPGFPGRSLWRLNKFTTTLDAIETQKFRALSRSAQCWHNGIGALRIAKAIWQSDSSVFSDIWSPLCLAFVSFASGQRSGLEYCATRTHTQSTNIGPHWSSLHDDQPTRRPFVSACGAARTTTTTRCGPKKLAGQESVSRRSLCHEQIKALRSRIEC